MEQWNNRSPTPFSAASKAVTVRRALQEGAEFLSRAGIESARLDAELLLGKAVGRAREALYRDYQVILVAGEQRVYESLLERRARGEPLAYITGEREFWSLPFYVTS
ncbi:MAG: peptide chain release factor N(5)-glutamine methyltransferase, partial [Deltaproteobacteria bacterium]|nr:peptide chain release factor N(5)-glutamine methyltransferase [Deltaproteobacteria bacterium]